MEEFLTIDLEEENDPPSFTQARHVWCWRGTDRSQNRKRIKHKLQSSALVPITAPESKDDEVDRRDIVFPPTNYP